MHVLDFRLALRTDCVFGVLTDVPVSDQVEFRGVQLPLLDLHTHLGKAKRDRVPFAVCFEAKGELAVIGVDTVDHIRVNAYDLKTLPSFGLNCPGIFEGGILDEEGLLMMIRAEPFLKMLFPSARND